MKKIKNITLNKFELVQDIPFLIQGRRHYYKSLDSVRIYEVFEDNEDFENAQTYYNLLANDEESSIYCELPKDQIELTDEINNTKQGYLLNTLANITLADLVQEHRVTFEFENIVKLMEKIVSCVHFLHQKFDIGHGNLHDQNIKFYYQDYTAGKLIDLITNKSINEQDMVVKVSQISPEMTELSLAFEPPELLLYNIGLLGNPENSKEAQKRDIWDLGLLFYELLTCGIHYVTGIHMNSLDGENELMLLPDEQMNWNLLCNQYRMLDLNEFETYNKILKNKREILKAERVNLATEYIKKNPKNENSGIKVHKLVDFIGDNMLRADPDKRVTILEIKNFLIDLM